MSEREINESFRFTEQDLEDPIMVRLFALSYNRGGQLNEKNPIEQLNNIIWKEIIKKFPNMEKIGMNNFNIEISNMLIELINLLRESELDNLYGEYYDLYLKNFLKNLYNDFNLKSLERLGISENDIISLNDVIYRNYYNILIDIENDYYLIFTNLSKNLSGDGKISVTELYLFQKLLALSII